MSNIQLQRDSSGDLHLVVGNQFAVGSKVTGVNLIDGELRAIVLVPLRHATFAEVTNVLPFVKPSSG